MTKPYIKLSPSFLNSAVWCMPGAAAMVWITMALMADEDGIVDACTAALATRAGVPLKDAEAALEALSAPDPDAVDQTHEGRRVARFGGRWRLLNSDEYSRFVDRTSERSKAAERQRKWRAAQKAKSAASEG